MVDWAKIERRYGSLVWCTVTSLLNEADARDCYQETFLAALKESRRNPVRKWPSLLRRIATQRAIDRLRTLKRQGCYTTTPTDVDQLHDPEPNPSKCAEAAELMEALKQALTELPALQAEIFWLRSVEDLSYSDIAEQQGVTTTHVGVVLHRARASLKERLKQFHFLFT